MKIKSIETKKYQKIQKNGLKYIEHPVISSKFKERKKNDLLVTNTHVYICIMKK